MNISGMSSPPSTGVSVVSSSRNSHARLAQGTQSAVGDGAATAATLSAEALAASQRQERPAGWQKILDEARLDPAFGRKYLEQWSGVTTDGPLLDISHPPEIRLSSTGEIWTDEKQVQYAALSAHVMQQRRDLIGAGLAEGIAPNEVLQRVYAFHDTLPQWYQDGMNWQ